MQQPQQMNHRASLLVLVLLMAGIFAVAPVAALKVEGARIALDVYAGKSVTSPIGISIKPEEAEGDFAIEVLGFGQTLTVRIPGLKR